MGCLEKHDQTEPNKEGSFVVASKLWIGKTQEELTKKQSKVDFLEGEAIYKRSPLETNATKKGG